MRRGLIGFGSLVAFMAAGVQPGSAAPRPWCLQEPGYTPSCLYHNFQQCHESANGLGYCMENPAIAWQRLQQGRAEPPPRRKPRPRRD
jgi:hypothetical protein